MTAKTDQTLDIELLSPPRRQSIWLPKSLCRKNAWRIVSGEWQILSPYGIIYINRPTEKNAENISVVGYHSWDAYTLQIVLKILTPSSKPPEGGAIVYFRFINARNYYSLHICLIKQKIELIKRFRGVWSTLAEQYCEIKTNTEHNLFISTHSSFHECKIDNQETLTCFDSDIQKGCVGIGVKYCDVNFRHMRISLHPEMEFQGFNQ